MQFTDLGTWCIFSVQQQKQKMVKSQTEQKKIIEVMNFSTDVSLTPQHDIRGVDLLSAIPWERKRELNFLCHKE